MTPEPALEDQERPQPPGVAAAATPIGREHAWQRAFAKDASAIEARQMVIEISGERVSAHGVTRTGAKPPPGVLIFVVWPR